MVQAGRVTPVPTIGMSTPEGRRGGGGKGAVEPASSQRAFVSNRIQAAEVAYAAKCTSKNIFLIFFFFFTEFG